jgi:hypothetical protein
MTGARKDTGYQNGRSLVYLWSLIPVWILIVALLCLTFLDGAEAAAVSSLVIYGVLLVPIFLISLYLLHKTPINRLLGGAKRTSYYGKLVSIILLLLVILFVSWYIFMIVSILLEDLGFY